jgi:hypothetical protein
MFRYFVDAFWKLHKVGLVSSRKQQTVFVSNEKILAFKLKLSFWKTYIVIHIHDNFPALSTFLIDTVGKNALCKKIQPCVKGHHNS